MYASLQWSSHMLSFDFVVSAVLLSSLWFGNSYVIPRTKSYGRRAVFHDYCDASSASGLGLDKHGKRWAWIERKRENGRPLSSLEAFTNEESAVSGEEVAVGSGMAEDILFATDILGDVNFCLRSTDSSLSGQSRSKLLNSITNAVFKAIIIGSNSGVEYVETIFDDFRIKVGQCKANGTVCDFSTDTNVAVLDEETKMSANPGRVVLETGEEFDFFNLTEKEDLTLAQMYIDNLENLLLKGEVGQGVLSASGTNDGKGNLYDRGYRRLLTVLKDAGCTFGESGEGRPRPPEDKNICLSLFDMSAPVTEPSVTKELNRISNVVSRAMLYGGASEKDRLALTMERKLPAIQKNFDMSDDSQEKTYLAALAYMLRNGLGPTQEQISGEYSNTGGFGESVVEGGIGQVKKEQGTLRLFDAYSNAFQRVVDTCLSEISFRRLPQGSQANDDFLVNFVQWEQSLRRNLTSDMWAANPKELAGSWELVDVSGMGSLQSVMVQDPKIFFGMNKGVKVNLLDDGRVEVDYPLSVGVRWFFKPGPAHLDTCEFTINSQKDATVELKYTGFIDRGQRIESRFSQQPIRMTGRVMSSIKGEPQGSCRFVMAKRK